MMGIYKYSVCRCQHLQTTKQSVPPAHQSDENDKWRLDYSPVECVAVLTGHKLSIL